jgi:maleylpyruvate isomerase
MEPMSSSGLHDSSQAFNLTVDALTAEDLAEPSLLPGWTRAHVVAHVALNGEALAACIEGLVHRRPVPMYASDAQRDADIDGLAQSQAAEVRDRALAATTLFAEAVELLEDEHLSASIDRLPGGPEWPVATIVPTRRREVEIHHVDLGASYTRADWPADFLRELLSAVTVDHAGAGPFRVRATDLGEDWVVGAGGGPTVTGTAADLGWWLTGRGHGEGLATDADGLPRLGPWRRASGTAAPTQET